ncbi:potassium-transporting ATPase subunit F [Cohnella xylanilytica]|uniref:Potassium-transporting ATPase subunit F n=1 Tax=Cohnella xylanilytica TaxID=557555 RepID=A0A841U456_9BACL|nr:potassium-transporting ATPase subunit F [Cohnella xylanilytica]
MRPNDRGAGWRRSSMIVVGIFILFVFLYLVYALIRPDKF